MRAAKKLPPVPFHALRHTHASVLIRAGVDILTISRASATAKQRDPGHLRPSYRGLGSCRCCEDRGGTQMNLRHNVSLRLS